MTRLLFLARMACGAGILAVALHGLLTDAGIALPAIINPADKDVS